MLVPAMLLAVGSPPAPPAPLPVCRQSQLRLSLDGRDGEFTGMSHAGTRLSIRNLGPDCLLPTLPTIELRDARARLLPAARRAPVGMHRRSVTVPVRLASGHRVATDVRWIAGPVFAHSRNVRAVTLSVRIGASALRVPFKAVLYGEMGVMVGFEQRPLRPVEGMAAG